MLSREYRLSPSTSSCVLPGCLDARGSLIFYAILGTTVFFFSFYSTQWFGQRDKNHSWKLFNI